MNRDGWMMSGENYHSLYDRDVIVGGLYLSASEHYEAITRKTNELPKFQPSWVKIWHNINTTQHIPKDR